MQEHLIELCVGDTIQVGQHKVRLLDIDGDQLCFEINGPDEDGIDEGAFATDDVLESV